MYHPIADGAMIVDLVYFFLTCFGVDRSKEKANQTKIKDLFVDSFCGDQYYKRTECMSGKTDGRQALRCYPTLPQLPEEKGPFELIESLVSELRKSGFSDNDYLFRFMPAKEGLLKDFD